MRQTITIYSCDTCGKVLDKGKARIGDRHYSITFSGPSGIAEKTPNGEWNIVDDHRMIGARQIRICQFCSEKCLGEYFGKLELEA